MDGASGGMRGLTMLVIVVVVAALYFAREVFIPFAVALLLSFLLGPLVTRLRRWHFGRAPAAICAVLLAGAVIGAVGTFISVQVYDIATKLPKYKQTILTKLHSLQVPGGGPLTHTLNFFRDTQKEITASTSGTGGSNASTPSAATGTESKPVPVEIKEPPSQPLKLAQRLLGSVLHPLTMAGIVFVFVVFMLIYREDLRDRLLRLVGMGQMHITTQALNDAARRISRYLLMQLVVNVIYGIPAGLGLYFIGVPNPVLWGVLCTLLRFIPYLGPTLGATLPTALAFAVDPGWSMMLWSLGLFITLELISNNFLEPMLYGSSTGLSPVAVITGAVFWTWLWGPVGLFMATPLTVCLVVIGRHFPHLSFFNVLFGDEPVLTPEARFYQRLLAHNAEEAADVADDFLKDKPLIEFYQTVLVPALSLAEQDRQRGVLWEKNQKYICQNTRDLVEDLAEHDDPEPPHDIENSPAVPAGTAPDHKTVVCIPARSGPDELLCLVMAQVLARRGVRTHTVSADALIPEWMEHIKDSDSTVACISTIMPSAFRHVRYRCRRLRNHFPHLKLIVQLWGTTGDLAELRQQLALRPMDLIVTSLPEAVNQVTSLAVTTHEPSTPQLETVPHAEPSYVHA